MFFDQCILYMHTLLHCICTLCLQAEKNCALYKCILSTIEHWVFAFEPQFTLHEEAKAGTLVLDVESVSGDANSDDQKSPQTSRSTDEKKENPKSDKTSNEEKDKEEGKQVVEETKETAEKEEERTEGAGNSKEEQTETQEAQCCISEEDSEPFEIIHVDPKTTSSPVAKESDTEQSSTINLDEIKVVDAPPSPEEEDKEHFYYVIDDVTAPDSLKDQVQEGEEKPGVDPQSTSLPPNGTIGEKRT